MVTKLQLRPPKRFFFAAVILLVSLVLVLFYRTYSGSEYALRKRVQDFLKIIQRRIRCKRILKSKQRLTSFKIVLIPDRVSFIWLNGRFNILCQTLRENQECRNINV